MGTAAEEGQKAELSKKGGGGGGEQGWRPALQAALTEGSWDGSGFGDSAPGTRLCSQPAAGWGATLSPA